MAETDIPETHRDLLMGPGIAILSTLGADQTIQSSLVWFDYRDGVFTINVVESSPKARNLARHPKATLLIMDNRNADRYLSVRCDVIRFQKERAIEHLDKLTKRNMDQNCWYGGAVEDDPAEAADRVIVCLKPERIYCTE